MPSTITDCVSARIKPEVVRELRKYAEQDGTTVSKYINALVRQEVRRRHAEIDSSGDSNA
jgi:hypothetical protein